MKSEKKLNYRRKINADSYTYKKVSDENVRTILQRIANQIGKDIRVHSGDRPLAYNSKIKGSNSGSLHTANRAADLHVKGLSDKEVFAFLKSKYNEIFNSSEAYEVIHHGPYTATGGEHLHIGRYGDGRSGYVKFKAEGLTAATKGNYHDKGSETKKLTTPQNAPLPEATVSGITVDAKITSPNVGVLKSVGIGGNNNVNEVSLVQQLINKAVPRLQEAKINFESFPKLSENGICDSYTKKAIVIFQRDVLGFSEPDGRVDPSGRTIRALYVAAYGNVNEIARNLRNVTLAPNPTDKGIEYNGVLAWGSHPRVSTSFREKTVRICNELGVKNPGWLMTVMAFETGRTFDPAKKNAAGSSGTGLIQFMKETIDGKTDKRTGKFFPGLGAKLGITHSQLAGMTAERQLDIVKAYFQQHGNKVSRAKDVDDLYFLVLLPSAYGQSDDTTMFQSGTKAYTQNKGLDTNQDGKVSVEETARKIRAMFREGLDKYPFPRR